MLADWFVFAPEGGPAWIYAVGTIAGNTATRGHAARMAVQC
jgi:hypothetical protein